jgi:hypothetical protein
MITEMIEEERSLDEQRIRARVPRCPTCAAFPRLLHSMLQPRTGKTVKLYLCQCGERIWDD